MARRTAELTGSYRETIYLLTSAAEDRDEETGNHIRRVSRYTAELAKALGCPAGFVDSIFFASALHDIGKIGVPDRILLKPGPLTPDEWELMKSHTVLGSRILSTGTPPYLKMGAEIALSHHERWDGSGYPNVLKAQQIPLPGRIMSVCDQYDALRSRRPYKPPRDHNAALRIMTEGRRAHAAPALLSARPGSLPLPGVRIGGHL